MSAIDSGMLDRFERAAMAYERLGKMTRDDDKTRQLRKETIAELAAARAAILAPQQAAPMPGVTARMLPAVEVHDVDTLPSCGLLVAIANVHEGCVIALQGTNGKMIGWIDTHAWTKGRVYRDQLLPPSEAGTSEREPLPLRNDEMGFVEFINSDAPYIARQVADRVDILHDVSTRKVIGYRVYDPAPSPAPVDGEAVRAWEYQDIDGEWHLCTSLDHKRGLEWEAKHLGCITPFRPLFAAAPSARKEP